MEMKDYKNQYFSILGDSISTLAGYNPPENAVFYIWENKRQAEIFTEKDTWWGHVIHSLGGTLLVNDSWSGSLVCKHPACEIPSYGCSDERTAGLGKENLKPAVVMILMGLNDYGWAMRPEAEGEEQNLAVFSVAYETMLRKIQHNYPNAEIWCITLPVSTWSQNPDFVPTVCRGGWRLTDYCRVIRNCAEKTGCRFVDIFDPCAPYDTIDGYHPTAGGMKTIADAVLRNVTGW